MIKEGEGSGDDFQKKMSAELTGGSFYRQTPRRPTRREVTPDERARRELMKEKIPLHVSNGLTDEAIARTLSLPVALVSQYISINNLRPKEVRHRAPISPEMTKALLDRFRVRLIELRDKEWTAQAICEDTGLDMSSIHLLLAKLLEEGEIARRKRQVYNGRSKRPIKYRGKQ